MRRASGVRVTCARDDEHWRLAVNGVHMTEDTLYDLEHGNYCKNRNKNDASEP
jgi:hypothetical protein